MLRGECVRVPLYESDASDPPPDQASRTIPGCRPPPPRLLSPYRSRNPKLKSILLLDPVRFQEVVENHDLIGWRYKDTSPSTPLESQALLPEEVWFEKLPHPFNFWRGLPPLFVAELATKTDFAASAYMRGIIENNCDNGLIVRTTEQLDENQREQIKAALRNRKRQAGTADRPLLLWNAAEVIPPTLSSADLQFLENRRYSRGEICAAFGVPEEIVCTTPNAKYDVMAGARQNFIENRIAPLCARLEAEEQVTVKAIDPDAVGWFDLDSLPIMQAARRSRLAAAKTGYDMGIPFNELNRIFDLGFAPLPWGNAGFGASSLQKLGELPQPVAHISIPKKNGELPQPAPQPSPITPEQFKLLKQIHAIFKS
jgi:hypothetical protein